jgi:hypothetical protein
MFTQFRLAQNSTSDGPSGYCVNMGVTVPLSGQTGKVWEPDSKVMLSPTNPK